MGKPVSYKTCTFQLPTYANEPIDMMLKLSEPNITYPQTITLAILSLLFKSRAQSYLKFNHISTLTRLRLWQSSLQMLMLDIISEFML